ncbi:MAG: nucleotide sugar dehydrogenase [Actinomycetota bacterium]|nr:nucleotide sugar dehydrogenase [Actinomycetota bacterium]MDA3012559.1 nucleotide sugar dehydrogenase [Actinomycetota bacterium]MDA3025562.1 nucleotide sugar dehydrogenase [Actinomycetota bacterium]
MTSADQPSLVVIGLGYVGLPLVVEAVRAGVPVTGFDVKASTVEGLNAGRSHVDDISDDVVGEMLAAGFRATGDASCLDAADVVVICVPTPLDGDGAPDLGAVRAATATVRDHLRPGTLVVLESTTYPGTTDGPVRAILEESGLAAGRDFHLAFSPERIDPGNPVWGLRNTPKIVGGLTPACTERVAEFYGRFVDTVVRVSGPREAELAKLLENTYRHINIALVNEMAVLSHELGVDLWESIDAARTKPFGFQAFYPGPGVGGHCIPIDPNYLSHHVKTLGYEFRFVELAQEISGRMPTYVVERVGRLLAARGTSLGGARVLLLGLTYKADIADDRETPARDVVRGLRAAGAAVTGHDPHLSSFAVDGAAIEMAGDLDAALSGCDVAVLLQAHSAYDLSHVAALAPVVFDTRGAMRGPNVERL